MFYLMSLMTNIYLRYLYNLKIMVYVAELRTHAQKVCSIYKKALRLIQTYYVQRNIVRYHQVMLRSEFENNRCVNDPKEQRRLLWIAENEVFMNQHPMPIKFQYSVGGVAHERVVPPPDWILDYWHPLEKAQYPQYFCIRELRKCDYIKKWQRGSLM